jgi:hypothetical protein
MKRLLLAAFASGLALFGVDPDSGIFPKLSPQATVSQTIGTTTVSIDYHRPQVRGRKIWGELVPFGQVWRTGANEATTIKFSDPVRVNGQPIPAGTYALFSIPGPEQWTLILNKRWRQFGAYEYQPKEDLIRFDVKAKVVKEHSEWLTYEVYPASRSSAYVDLYWEKLRVSFLVDVDVDAMVTARMKRAMSRAGEGDWKIYSDAAEYFLEQEKELNQALIWADKSVRIQENPTNLSVKARILRAISQPAQAYQTMEKALKIARAQGASGAVIGPIQSTLDGWKKQNGGAAPAVQRK